jgi:hypothetical protein
MDSKLSHSMALSINNSSIKYVSLNKYFVVVNAGAVVGLFGWSGMTSSSGT